MVPRPVPSFLLSQAHLQAAERDCGPLGRTAALSTKFTSVCACSLAHFYIGLFVCARSLEQFYIGPCVSARCQAHFYIGLCVCACSLAHFYIGLLGAFYIGLCCGLGRILHQALGRIAPH